MDNHGFEQDSNAVLAKDEKQQQSLSEKPASQEVKLDIKDEGGGTGCQLERQVGLLGSVSMIVGTMIGSGIFVTPGHLLAQVGSVWLSLGIWAACGLVSTFGAMTYIELGTVVPSSGGDYVYLLKAFGPIPAFIFSWMSTIVLKPAAVAIGCQACAQYAIQPFVDDIADYKWGVLLLTIVVISLITLINCFSVKLATQVQIIFTIAKLMAIAVIIGCGAVNVYHGKTQHLEFTLEGSIWNYGRIASAFYSGLWAYDGWNQLNYITEELKSPYKNLPRAILIGLPLVTFCYLAVNLSFLTALSPAEVSSSSAVAVLFGNRMLGIFAFLMPLSVVMSTFGSVNGGTFASARREGHLMDFLSFIDIKRKTPSPALLFNSALGILFAVFLNIEELIDFFSFTAWIFYGATIASLFRLRYTLPDAPRPFKVPLVIPGVMVLLSGYLVLAPIIDNPRYEYMYAIAFMISGILVYIPFVHYGFVLPGTDCFTSTIQKVFKVKPIDPSDEKSSSASQSEKCKH